MAEDITTMTLILKATPTKQFGTIVNDFPKNRYQAQGIGSGLAQQPMMWCISHRMGDSDVDDLRMLIIVDEVHRVIPEDGVFIKNIEQAVPGRKLRVLLTATPKKETPHFRMHSTWSPSDAVS